MKNALQIKELSNSQGIELTPLFIGGCARSGTTVLAKIISEKFKFVVTPESQFKSDPNYFKDSRFYFGIKDHIEILKSKRFKGWDIHEELLFDTEIKSFDLYLDYIVSRFAKKHNLGAHPWLDHTPNNIKHFKFLKEIFPKASLIHVVRDGRAVYNSVKSLSWGPSDVRSAVSWWKGQVLEGLSLEYFYPNDVIMVKYEDILNKEPKTIKKLEAFLINNGYQFNDQVQDIFIPKYSNSQHTLVNKGIDLGRIDSYIKELDKKEIKYFDFHGNSLLEDLGYVVEKPLHYDRYSILHRLWFRIKRFVLVHFCYRIKNALRFN
jgi:hypothetical protein